MDTKPSINSYHHQRAPRTPESYFNVPESIALLNIVKSERIQSAFQSNRKNHASVWEMVAEVLNRFSARKRSAKQCCNRYENLKKIYTQLKKNPERHVRRNWPYMFLFKEIEEQRGECWGSNAKRLSLIAKNHKDLSYYHRRRQASDMGLLMNKDVSLSHAQSIGILHPFPHSTDSNSNNSKMERFLPNQFVETQLSEGANFDEAPLQLQVNPAIRKEGPDMQEMPNMQGMQHMQQDIHRNNAMHQVGCENLQPPLMLTPNLPSTNGIETNGELHKNDTPMQVEYEKDCNGALNLQTTDNAITLKSEPLSEGEFNPDDIQLMQTNYNGSQNFYPHNIDPNILHPDVIVDTDNISDCTSASLKSKRKLSTSTDGGDSTNYELIEYLKRREKRDEELLKRLESLLERTVVAIETLARKNCTPQP